MNYTEHIDLSQIEANDKPTWLNMYNSDMRKIDNAVGDLMTTTSSVSGTLIPELIKDVDNLQKIAAKNTSDIAINTSSIGALKLEDGKLATDIDTLDNRESAHYNALSGSADVNKQAIKDIQDQQIVLQANLQTTRNLAANNASSINKLQGRVTIIEDNYNNTTSDIDNLRVDVDNLKTETDTLDTTTRQHDNDISNLKTSVNANTTNISSIDSRVQTLEALPTRVDTLETTATELRTDVDKNAGDIAANDADITALQTKTANITNGVNVPFGFGTTADGERGYEKTDGTIESFGTSSDIAEINRLIGEINNKIAALNTKTANIQDGKALPFSLAIESSGGAYGYIKNGETGVTPFLTSEDVDRIVDITPIQSKVNALETTSITMTEKTKNISGSPSITSTFKAQSGLLSVPSISIQRQGNNNVTVRFGKSTESSQRLDFPFGLGIDSNGNYGYFKVGADTVTPFSISINIQAPFTTSGVSVVKPTAYNTQYATIENSTIVIPLSAPSINSAIVLTPGPSDSVSLELVEPINLSLNTLPYNVQYICKLFNIKTAYNINLNIKKVVNLGRSGSRVICFCYDPNRDRYFFI